MTYVHRIKKHEISALKYTLDNNNDIITFIFNYGHMTSFDTTVKYLNDHTMIIYNKDVQIKLNVGDYIFFDRNYVQSLSSELFYEIYELKSR